MDAKIIGNKITKARKEAGLSQAQLAKQLFISPQAVGKWERGASVPDILTINRLGTLLAVDLNYFSDNTQPVITPAPFETHEAHGNAVLENALKNPEDLTSFNGSNLPESDFAGIVAPKSKFNGSNLQGADFSDADLTGSSFHASNLCGARFNGANLTDCIISACYLTRASFEKTILVRTKIKASEPAETTFTKVRFADVLFVKIDLRKAIFEDCTFDHSYFKYADLSGVCFDGQIFTGVCFDRTFLEHTSFKGATLKNVSFRSTNVITNKYYKAIKTVNFDGAKMDKLTIAALKGYGANLSNIVII